MKEDFKIKFQKIFKSDKLPYIILFLAILFANFLKSTTYGDDIWFANITTGNINEEITSIFKYISWRYDTWSSRLIIETFLILFTKKFSMMWRILDAFIYVILAYSLSRLFRNGKNKELQQFNWLVVLLIFCIPFGLISSAGWIATSLNYSWAIAFGLFSLIPIRKTIDSEKIKWYEYVLYVFACIYACNVEQVCLCVFGVYLIFNIYFIVKKKVKKINILMFLVAILSLTFILTCPRK